MWYYHTNIKSQMTQGTPTKTAKIDPNVTMPLLHAEQRTDVDYKFLKGLPELTLGLWFQQRNRTAESLANVTKVIKTFFVILKKRKYTTEEIDSLNNWISNSGELRGYETAQCVSACIEEFNLYGYIPKNNKKPYNKKGKGAKAGR